MKISIITVCYNSQNTIEDTIKSVLSQNHYDLEYIIIDGGSSDNTINVINEYTDKIYKVISEKDEGIYDAINKGIFHSTGDIIGILNSDDIFSSSEIISKISSEFELNPELDIVYGDVEFINNFNEVIRRYSSKRWRPQLLYYGYMPAHPTIYCKKECFSLIGNYRIDLSIAGDFELVLRFFNKAKLSYKYLNMNMVTMKLGGVSTRGVSSTIEINKQILRSFAYNNLKTNYLKLYLRYFRKFFEFI